MDAVRTQAGETTQWILGHVAGLVEPWAGDADWGVAIVLVMVGWQLPLLHWGVRSSTSRILRAAVADRVTTEGAVTGPEARTEVRARLRDELEARGLRRPLDVVVGRVIGIVSLALVVVVVVWSRTGDDASGAGFAGLRSLAESPVRSGVAGVAWALALAGVITVAQVLTLRAAAVRDERQRFFGTRILPVMFVGLGLFLPAATVIGFVASLALSCVTTAIAARDASLAEPSTPAVQLVTP